MTHQSLPLSLHASIRCQQRGLSAQALEWLDHYGARAPAGQSADIVFFDKSARRRLRRSLGSAIANRLAPLFNAYMVQAQGGTVVTAGWRTKRIDRKGPRHHRNSK